MKTRRLFQQLLISGEETLFLLKELKADGWKVSSIGVKYIDLYKYV